MESHDENCNCLVGKKREIQNRKEVARQTGKFRRRDQKTKTNRDTSTIRIFAAGRTLRKTRVKKRKKIFLIFRWIPTRGYWTAFKIIIMTTYRSTSLNAQLKKLAFGANLSRTRLSTRSSSKLFDFPAKTTIQIKVRKREPYHVTNDNS